MSTRSVGAIHDSSFSEISNRRYQCGVQAKVGDVKLIDQTQRRRKRKNQSKKKKTNKKKEKKPTFCHISQTTAHGRPKIVDRLYSGVHAHKSKRGTEKKKNWARKTEPKPERQCYHRCFKKTRIRNRHMIRRCC